MDKTILIVGFVWPEPKSSAAGSRMLQLIDCFQTEGFNIVFASASSINERAFDLASIGVRTEEVDLNSSSFDAFIQKLNPHVVLFDRFMTEEQFGWRVTEHCPDALKILDTEDLHCLRRGRQQAIEDHKAFDKRYLFNNTAKREIASIYRCDLSLIISETEMEILKNQFNIDENLLLYLPFMLDKVSIEQQHELPDFEERNHFVTIGNFLHKPNYNAVIYLKDTIWPLIKKKLPDAEMHVYGAYASQKAHKLHNDTEGFLIKGFAKDVNKVMQKSIVCLAPLQFGAGLKGKIFDAMINGTPCVLSSVAAEGIFGDFKPNGFIENNPKKFAESAIQLYTNEVLWNKNQENGFKVINERFHKSNYQMKFLKRIKCIQSNLTLHRENNFIGNMLNFHILQSTKYMSKWIEEKNRNKS